MENIKLVCWIIVVNLLKSGSGTGGKDSGPDGSKNRASRSLVFPHSSAIGILFALAIPLDLPDQNVIFSYNFEVNYNVPVSVKEIIPGPLDRFDLVDNDSRDLKCDMTNNTCLPSSSARPRSKKKKKKHRKRPKRGALWDGFVTRKQFYKFLMDNIKGAGYNGRECLLRMICEVNLHSIGVYNGVVGSLMHIMFSPSTSQDEDLHDDYYMAEYHGVTKDCSLYEEMCKDSILDMISKDFWVGPF